MVERENIRALVKNRNDVRYKYYFVVWSALGDLYKVCR